MNEIRVAKFGGSSLADSSQFKKVKEIISLNENRKYIIPSAPGKRDGDDHKVTDLLYMCYQLASHGINFDEVFNIVEKRYIDIYRGLGLDFDIDGVLLDIKNNIRNGKSRDYVASRGEYLNALLLANYLGFEFIDAGEIIVFDQKGKFNEKLTREKAAAHLKDIEYGVIPGFYGANIEGEVVTFSRGGSDVTGAIIADAVGAGIYENWTDVSGFLVADPRIVNNPKPIEKITYKELRELSYMGASVLHEEAIYPVREKRIPIKIKNTNKPKDKGTLIVDDLTSGEGEKITGIAGKKDFTVITIEKSSLTTIKGFFRKLFSVFETNDISVEHMPSSMDSISVIVSSEQLNSKLNKIREEIKIYCNPDKITTHPNMALIAVVGRGMIKNKGMAGQIFNALARGGINIRMITQGSSELNIIVGVENEDFESAIEAIYREFY